MTIDGITEHDIANYLVNTPGFFMRHAELLASVQLTSPHGQRAVSLQERQMEMLRERIKGLEQKIIEMIRNSQDNMAIADRLHQWTMRLLLTRDAAQLPQVLPADLQQRFQIPQVALRVWGVAEAFADLPAAQPVSDDLRAFAGSLSLPYCGANAGFEASAWFDEAAAVQSMAMLPLRAAEGDDAFGLLVLGSPDPTRYAAQMGTEFLARIGELAGAALARLLAD
ncbi:MAG: DUF484 family protein [Rubrivivax sp.]|nr:DUF484 family protein [Rubrivivax sp.]HRY88397.1 DUF484 family protein [Rubrivivax sp.]